MDHQPLRTAGSCTVRQAGVDWDAIRIPHQVGLRVLEILGARTGAVVEARHSFYWFVPVGTAQTWDVPETVALGQDAWVTVPPERRTQPGADPFWHVCPTPDTWHTDPAGLRAAIADVHARPAVTA